MWRCHYCKRPASTETAAGLKVCRAHGGTTPAQRDPVAQVRAVEQGRKPPRPPGRPLEHGLYSKRDTVRVDQIVQDYQARGVDPDSTEEDMLYLRAHLELLKENAPDAVTIMDEVRALSAAVDTLKHTRLSDGESWFDSGQTISRQDMKVEDALRILEALDRFDERVRNLTGLLKALGLFTAGLEGRHTNLIKLAKDRADTRLKNKAARELDVFTMMTKRLLVLLEEVLPRDIYLALRKRYVLDFAEVPVTVLGTAQALPGNLNEPQDSSIDA